MSSIILIVLLIVFMYFFMIRPQQKQRKQHESMMSKLRPGDHVVTISRLHGVISEINEQEKTVTLDCEGIYLTFDMVAIQRVESKTKSDNSQPAEKEAPAGKKDEESSSEAKDADDKDETKSTDAEDK